MMLEGRQWKLKESSDVYTKEFHLDPSKIRMHWR